ncbi:MAG: hypothetical protein J5506_07360 [Prevotella sp.]|nr:hypothetical protein [Prevotella sp.]
MYESCYVVDIDVDVDDESAPYVDVLVASAALVIDVCDGNSGSWADVDVSAVVGECALTVFHLEGWGGVGNGRFVRFAVTIVVSGNTIDNPLQRVFFEIYIVVHFNATARNVGLIGVGL